MTDPRTQQMIDWAQAFTDAWSECVDGALDIHHTLDWAYELWPAYGQRDAGEVAREQFKGAS